MNPLRFTPRLLTAARRSQAGITLVETTVVSSVLAVLTGLAAPSFDSSIQRRHLEGAATQLETDIHHARMLAVARNAPLRMSFESGRRRQLLRDPHRRGQPVRLRRRRQPRVPGRGAWRSARCASSRVARSA